MEKINFQKNKYKIGAASAALVLIFVIIFLTTNYLLKNTSQKEPKNLYGLIVPHHRLVEFKIEEYYKLVPAKNIKKIILISPNHFNHGYYRIQSTEILNKKFEKISLNLPSIKLLNKNLALRLLNKKFEKEHGITVHYSLIEKYFPGTKIIPIIIKENTAQKELDNLIQNINKLDLNNTLIIASIDFVHYEDEKSALIDDSQTINWIKNWEKNDLKNSFSDIKKLAEPENKEAIAIDSPETLYLLYTILANNNCDQVIKIDRSSSNSLLKQEKPLENTSHLYTFITQ